MVMDVLMASTQRAGPAAAKRSNSWARTKVPAATIVAAWISAEAGGGASIGCGGQSWEGGIADLPRMRVSSRSMAMVGAPAPAPAYEPITAGYAVEPACAA